MKGTIIVLTLATVLLFGGCQQNPVAPVAQPEMLNLPDLDSTAHEAYAKGENIVTAAGKLKSTYAFSVDTLLGALSRAGYNPSELVTALKMVFQQQPLQCEQVLSKIGIRLTGSGISELILRAYVDSISLHQDEMNHFLSQVESVAKAAAILDSLYAYEAQTVIERLYKLYPSKVTEIVTVVRNLYPSFSGKEIAAVLNQLGVRVAEALNALRAGSVKPATELFMALRDAGYGVVDVVSAFRSELNTPVDQIAEVLDGLRYSLLDVIAILHSASYDLDDLAMVLKNHYKQDASEAADILWQFKKDLSSFTRALRDQYQLSLGELLRILQDHAIGLPAIVHTFNDMHYSTFEIADVLKGAGYDVTEILRVLKNSLNTPVTKLARILDGFGYAMEQALGTLKAIDCGYDSLATVLKDYYHKSAEEAAARLQGLGANFPDIADAVKSIYETSDEEIARILKNLGATLAEIIQILKSWKLPIDVIIEILKRLGFIVCDILHHLNLPCWG